MTDRKELDATLTVAEVASIHRVTRRTVERWIKSGALPASKLPGGLVRIREADSQALLTPSPSAVSFPHEAAGVPAEAVAS